MQSVSEVQGDSVTMPLHLDTVVATALWTGWWVHTLKAVLGFSFGVALYVL